MKKIIECGNYFLLCPRCEQSFDPVELMGNSKTIPTYCATCNRERLEQLDVPSGIALLTVRRKMPNNSNFCTATKRRYQKIKEAGGRVFVLLDPDRDGEGEVFEFGEWKKAVFGGFAEWMQNMRDLGLRVEYGWR